MTTTSRRPLLLALAGGTAAVAGIGTAARTGLLGPDGPDARGRLRLSAGDMGVERLSLPLDRDLLLGETAGRPSARLATTTFTMVGFTWQRGGSEPAIEMSVRRNGSWQPWQAAPHVHESSDPATDEATGTVGTEVVWVGPADGVRVRVDGRRPKDLTMVLLHPTPLPGDTEAGVDDPTGDTLVEDSAEGTAGVAGGALTARTVAATSTSATATTTAMTAASAPARSAASTSGGTVPRPRIRNRREWGANESLRTGNPSYISTIMQVHVHHTVNSNTYSRDDVPAMIRGMYAYHTQSLGWSDIGYNFLVDRFGRIWTGRYGGAAKNVRGAHTLGFNGTSTGVSVIGNYDQATPSKAVIAAIARVAAWKLDRYGRDPLGRITVTSEGSDKYARGQRVTLPVIDGHRDTNDTSCPGKNLYAALPAVRRKTRTRMDNYHQAQRTQVVITEPFAAAGSVVAGRTVRVKPGTWTPSGATPSYTWLRDGSPISGARAARYTVTTGDIGSRISTRIDVTAPDADPASQTVSWPNPARAQTSLTVNAAGRKGRARVTVRASAPGLPGGVPTGDVVVTLAGKRRTLTLAEGRASVVIKRLTPGTYECTATFAPTPEASGARATDTVVVKPTD